MPRRKRFWRAGLDLRSGFIAIVLTLWPLSSAATAEKSYPKPKGWDQLVGAARKEGTVAIYRGIAFGPGGRLGEAFAKSYPGIKVLETVGGGSQQLNRIFTERRAGLHIPDILIGGTTDPVLSLKPAGAVAPLKPFLVLPEVVDPSAWLDNRFWWVDQEEPHVNLMFIGYVQTLAYVNPKMVDPKAFRSYWDILDPQWKGKDRLGRHPQRRAGRSHRPLHLQELSAWT